MNSGILIRILGPMSGLSLALLLIGVLAARYIERQQHEQSQLIHREFRGMLVIEELYVKMRDIRWECALFARSGDRKHLDDVAVLLTASQRPLDAAEEAARTPEELQLIRNVEQGFDRFSGQFRQLLAGSSTPQPAQIQQLIDEQLTTRILGPIEECLRYSQLVVERADETAVASARLLRLGFLLLGITGCIAGLFVGLGISRAISRSIVQLDISVRSMAGQLNEVSAPVQISRLTDLQGVEHGVRQLESELGHIVDRLQRQESEILRSEQLATVGQLAAGMAHELRNPLTPVKMLVQGALERDDARGLSGRDLQIVSDEVLRLEKSIQTFLDFARPPLPEPAMVCVCQLVRNSCDLVAAQASHMGIEIRTSLPSAGLIIFADGVQLRQVFLNLLLNALEVMPSGGWVQIAVSTQRRPDRTEAEFSEHDALRASLATAADLVRITVTDNGPGFPCDQIERAFQPFFTTRETGTGLGLSICQRIIHDHDGTISLELPAEGGTRFVIELPRRVSPVTGERLMQTNFSTSNV
jgi:signal transduction histidine kinase